MLMLMLRNHPCLVEESEGYTCLENELRHMIGYIMCLMFYANSQKVFIKPPHFPFSAQVNPDSDSPGRISRCLSYP